jgi:hypothetical protein
VRAELGTPTGVVDDRAPLPKTPAAPPPPRAAVGYYGLIAVSVVGVNDTPLNYEVAGSANNMSLPSFGLRAGYRLAEPIAIEANLDIGRLDAEGACQREGDDSSCRANRNFSLRSLRVGPNLRLMTRGETIRFATGIGVGLVNHTLDVEPAVSQDGTTLQGGSASGLDAYFSLELAAAANYRHLYGELGVIALIEGATGLRGKFDEGAQQAVFSNGTLPMLGLTLKVGYSSWSSKR